MILILDKSRVLSLRERVTERFVEEKKSGRKKGCRVLAAVVET